MTIAAHTHVHQWTLADTQAQVGYENAQHRGLRTWLRDEEAAGSNPATPTIELQVAALFRDKFRLPIPAAFRFWERTGAERAQPTSLTSGNAPFL